MDIKLTFLQGSKVDREAYLKPPVEAETSKLWKLVYELCDAQHHWYLSLKYLLLRAVGTKKQI